MEKRTFTPEGATTFKGGRSPMVPNPNPEVSHYDWSGNPVMKRFEGETHFGVKNY